MIAKPVLSEPASKKKPAMTFSTSLKNNGVTAAITAAAAITKPPAVATITKQPTVVVTTPKRRVSRKLLKPLRMMQLQLLLLQHLHHLCLHYLVMKAKFQRNIND